jgi:hypothetical protein
MYWLDILTSVPIHALQERPMLKLSSAEVSAARDTRNRKDIERMANAPLNHLTRGITPDWRWQLEEGTPEDRVAYLKKIQRRVDIWSIPVALLVVAFTEVLRRLWG